ncbi:hypothetical protein ACFSKU_06610 [Pontibacter silvestris]|uniref:Uncharacterized protein n=1 Tax=Pontibacter silvestris TaxID=2305183 RepID=A0ABW4WVZ7_9BACT|nr:hypothetical protein [Pontibacter silvestris]MCC9138395.1 hypothetical protein [Pontibacter silvestris]
MDCFVAPGTNVKDRLRTRSLIGRNASNFMVEATPAPKKSDLTINYNDYISFL